MHTHLAWRILAFVRVFFFSMYQFGFFPLTSTVCGKGLVNIQEWAPFYINRRFLFCNKLMSSCNLAKHFGVWKQTHFWKVHILRKINISCFYCFSWLRNSTPQFSSSLRLSQTRCRSLTPSLPFSLPAPGMDLRTGGTKVKITGWDQNNLVETAIR